MLPEDDTDALEPGMAECWRAPWSNIESYKERVLDANEMRPLSPMKSGEVSPSMETNRLPNSSVQFIPRKAAIFASVVVPSESCLTTLGSWNIFWQCHVLTDHLAASWFHNLPILGRNEMHGHAHTAAQYTQSYQCLTSTYSFFIFQMFALLPLTILDHLWPSLTSWMAFSGAPFQIFSVEPNDWSNGFQWYAEGHMVDCRSCWPAQPRWQDPPPGDARSVQSKLHLGHGKHRMSYVYIVYMDVCGAYVYKNIYI